VNESKTDTTASRFAANIRSRRESRGLSQRELAQALVDLGHSSFRQQTIAEIEAGSRQVKLDEALACSRALGITVDRLIRRASLTKEANELLDSAREALETTRHATHWVTERDAARRRLHKAVTKGEGNEAELADELAVARRALADTEDKAPGPKP
jgi:transcriptional regulator with XRE-family HTH domain